MHVYPSDTQLDAAMGNNCFLNRPLTKVIRPISPELNLDVIHNI